MEKINIYYLHGFLGQGQDWDLLSRALKEAWVDKEINAHKLDLFSPNALIPPTKDLKAWAKEFNGWVAGQSGKETNFLIGYSLGGRLAMHALIENDSQWRKAYLLSCHPGMLSLNEKKQRQMYDQSWSEKIKNEDWETLQTEWNSQIVFEADAQPPIRKEDEYNRGYLDFAIKHWSVANHEFTLDDLKNINVDLHWFCGEWDVKYCGIYSSLKSEGLPGSFHLVPAVGHRVLFAQSLPKAIFGINIDNLAP